MDIVGIILKQFDLDIEFDDILDAIHRFSPGLAMLIAGIVGIGGIILIVTFFMAYLQ